MTKLSKQQTESKIKFINNYINAKNNADASKVDANANVDSKNIATLEAELHKDFNIQINRNIIKRKMTELFSEELAEKYISQIENHDIYCHDESTLKPYCVAISMFPFLQHGLTKLGGESKAPEHLESYCGSFVNLIFAISSQFAGAVATVEFLMCFDYFARKDYGENYLETHKKTIENHLQHVVYALNQPASARNYQCVREDTTQLSTPEGYKYLSELKVGDECYVYVDGKIEIQKIERLNVYDFDGELMQFKGRNYQQTVTNNHRVLYKKCNTNDYDIKEAHELFGHSKLSLPIGCGGVEREDYGISDEILQLCVSVLTDGSISNSGSIKIYKSKNRYGYKEIPQWLNKLGIGYKEISSEGNDYGDMVYFSINSIDAKIITRQLKYGKVKVPYFFKLLSKRQIELVLNTWSKFDGQSDDKHTQLLQCDNEEIQNSLQELATLAGIGSELYFREMKKYNSEEPCIVKYVKLFKRKDKRISQYNLVQYTGRVWCPTTKAGIVIFREENKIPYISGNSVFWNISIFDKYYYNGLFDKFVFPDGSKPKWETLSSLQKFFMKWFNKERTKAVLTFPVVTFAGLTDNQQLKDKDYEEFVSQELSEGNAFFLYLDDNVASLSSCCFSADQKCLTRASNGINYMSFKELKNSNYNSNKNNLTIFHNGSWVKGVEVELPKREMYEIITANNKKIIVSDNHLNPSLDGDKLTTDLTENDYLLFNNNKLDAIPEKDESLTYEHGYIVGSFIGNGSFGSRRANEQIYEINFSMNKHSYKKIMTIIDKISNNNSYLSSIYNNVYPVRISDKSLVAFIQKWTNWKEGTKSYSKELNLECLTQSFEFRQGILQGWYDTDGGNSNRCYTTSSKLAEHMEVLITSLGMNSIIDVFDRTNEKVVIRECDYNRNYPLYCVRWYESKNKRSMANVFVLKNNSIYFKIKSIKKIDYKHDNIYCFEMKNKNEPYFTLPNGLITHNCRLRNDISDQLNEFSYTLGGTGVMTGSMNVITMNLNKIIQDAVNSNRDIFECVREQTQLIHKYQLAFKAWFKELQDADLLPVYSANFITLKKQFLTVGINGLVESAEFLNLEISNNKEYKEYSEKILKTISDENKISAKKYGCKFNTEFVPAENLGVKHAIWDKKSGYKVNRTCYNSYMYKVEDDEISILDKIILHGRQFMKYLDGGSALHLNLENYPTKETFKKLLNVAVIEGCNYLCFNVKITICNDCNHIDKRTLMKCSKCGSKNIDYATRVIGYLKRVKSFSTPRQNEENLRHYHKKGVI